MIYISTDVETTVLKESERKPENLLQLSMVYEDTSTTKDVPVWELPHFTCVVDHRELKGEIGALAMNAWLIKMIDDYHKKLPTKYPVLTLAQLEHQGSSWLAKLSNKPMPMFAAGQNVGTFDLKFLPESIVKCLHYRTIETGSVFLDPQKGPLGLGAAKESLGFDKYISHNAYHEAMDVVLCLRTKYSGNLTPYDRAK